MALLLTPKAPNCNVQWGDVELDEATGAGLTSGRSKESVEELAATSSVGAASAEEELEAVTETEDEAGCGGAVISEDELWGAVEEELDAATDDEIASAEEELAAMVDEELATMVEELLSTLTVREVSFSSSQRSAKSAEVDLDLTAVQTF